MNINRVEFEGISVMLPKGWIDVTDELDEGSPSTLRKKNNALGALQLAVRLYQPGKSPNIDMDKMTSLLNDFSAKNELGTAGNIKKCNEGMLSISAEFVSSGEFVCIWYASENNNLAMITYGSTHANDPLLPNEVAEADQIVKSIIFENKV